MSSRKTLLGNFLIERGKPKYLHGKSTMLQENGSCAEVLLNTTNRGQAAFVYVCDKTRSLPKDPQNFFDHYDCSCWASKRPRHHLHKERLSAHYPVLEGAAIDPTHWLSRTESATHP
jgi:hypothetical protein